MRTIKNRFFVISFSLFGWSSFGQSTKLISLDELQRLAQESYPLLKQKDIYNEIASNKVQQLKTNFLPQANVVGQATYQSEVTSFNIPMPGLSGGFSQKPDQYSFGMELRENLFDYGQIKGQKQIEQQNADIQNKQIDIEFQKVKDRINQLYGNIWFQRENKQININRINELDAKIKRMESAVKNGATLKSNLLVLEAEKLTSKQKLEEINSNLVSWYKVLSILTNKSMDTSTYFSDKISSFSLQSNNIRSEYKVFDLQATTLKMKTDLISRSNLPKVFVFARGYYGRPGYNFMNNNFRTYGLVGAGISWSLTNYYTSGKDKKNLLLNNDLISNQKQLFDLNLQSIVVQQLEEISKLEKLIALDQQIVDTKIEVRKASSSQLDNGIITSSDYVADLNNENQAQLNQAMHEIQLMIAKQNYNSTLGY